MKDAGRYHGDWGDVQVLLTDRGLEVIAPITEDPMQGRITLTPVAEHTFRMPATILTTPPASDARGVLARRPRS